MREIKQPTTYAEQVEILESRDCSISDEAFCVEKLSSVNYYRLSAYFLPFKSSDGSYRGVSFHRVYQIYEFDRKIRSILFSALEEVEIFLRSQLAYFHAHKYGSICYLDSSNYNKKHDHTKFEENINREIKNNKTVQFVKHHLNEYDGNFPIWVICELFTFGMLSYFFNDLVLADQKLLSKTIYGTVPKNVSSWLHCCTDLRNICAHYGRLYFRRFTSIPGGLNISEREQRRLWGAVLSLKALYPHPAKWNSEVLPSLEALFEEYRSDIDLYHIAFPKDWAAQLKKQHMNYTRDGSAH